MSFYTNVKLEKPFTWVKYQEGMCSDCVASCCKLKTDVTVEDLIGMGVLTEFHKDEPLKNIAKQLKKEGIVKHFNLRREIFTLAQRDNDECIYLDEVTRKCTVYEGRPLSCRKHPEENIKPNYCAYIKQGSPTIR